jgi:hypothetical protein
LIDAARAANVSLEDFAHDTRRLMQLPEGQNVPKKFLCDTMMMAQFNTARARYGEVLRVILNQDVPDYRPQKGASHGITPTHVDSDPSQARPEAASASFTTTHYPTPREPAEDPAAVSSQAKSSFAPDLVIPAGTTTDEAKAAVRTEALSWGLSGTELDFVLTHHRDLEKACGILLDARAKMLRNGRETPAPHMADYLQGGVASAASLHQPLTWRSL